MTQNKVYLKPNVVFEPLVDRWYAWSHLISPATAAMNISGRHMAIMNSYLSAPEIHAEAVLNPKMRGGPFMDLGYQRVKDIFNLKNETERTRGNMLEFAKAVKVLDDMLRDHADGGGIENLYKQVPDILKGYVELFYDRNSNPGFRFFEALLYKSQYYDERSQSMALWVTNNDHRPFCLSTPRLPEANVLILDIPFRDKGIDELARMKVIPQTIDYIKSILNIEKGVETLFDSFFTDIPHSEYQKYTGESIRMRYFGHACILIETKDVTILVDPLISYYGYHSDVEHFSDIDLPDIIDYVIITHNHQDHILFETLLPLRHRIQNIIVPRSTSGLLEDPNLKLMFDVIGFKNVIEIDEMETIHFHDITITGIPFTGEHSDLNIKTKMCHHVQIGSFKLMFMADSRIMEPELYKHIYKIVGDVDVVFIGMECDGAPLTWLYGPLLTKRISRDHDGSRRLSGSDCNRGLSIVDIFRPKEAYVYAMGQEPWVEFITSSKYTDESNPIVQSDKFVHHCIAKGIVSERLFGEKELLYQRI